MNHDQAAYSRAAAASLLGLIVQAAMAGGLWLLGRWSGSPAVAAAVWYALGALPVWLCLWIVHQQHKLERLEALEADQLSRQAGADSSIFQASADDLRVARRRLERLHRWALPITSLLIAAYFLLVGWWRGSASLGAMDGRAPIQPGINLPLIGFLAGMTLVAFLVSRYLAGMARSPAWTLLRGGAGLLMGGVLINLCLITGLIALELARVPGLLAAGALLAPAVMIVIGCEIALNFILGLYRPRRPGESPRPAFDSRLLSLLTSPESIARTVSEAINYQFGFEITRSWFWQLLARTFLGLAIFAVAAMAAVSCLVVVEPHQRAVVTRFGRLAGPPLEPGLHLKWPWPIGQSTRYDVTSVRSLDIGSSMKLLEDVPILWSNEHDETRPDPLIVAPTPGAPAAGAPAAQSRAPGISLVVAEISLHYRPDPDRLLDYVAAQSDPAEPDVRLRQIAVAAVGRALLRHDIDRWIGVSRVGAGSELAGDIRRAADQAKLGVQIVGVSLASVHPPREVADAFHEVIGAEQERQTAVERARQDAIQTLARVAGSPDQADRILRAIADLDARRAAAAPADALSSAEAQIERLMAAAGGETAVKIAEARGYRWKRENAERAKADRFAAQLAAARAAPEFFRARYFLQTLAETLAGARKVVLAGDRAQLVLRGDLKDTAGGLSSILDAAAPKSGDAK